ncbi:hypothetical protein KCU60_g57, partial [Aureobasidium melanogenum]
MLRKDDVYSGLGEAIRPYSETSKLSYSEPFSWKVLALEAQVFRKNHSSKAYSTKASDASMFGQHPSKCRVLLQSLTDEATESGPPVGGAAGIRGSLSRDLSVFNFIFPSAGFAFLTLTILLSSPRAPSIPSALSSSSIPSHSSSLFPSSSGKASASESKAVFSFFPGRRRFRGFFCDFSMREMRESCFNARFPALVFADEVLTSGAAVAGREAAATLARIVVRFLPLVGACKTSEAVYLVCQRAMEKPLRVATAKVVPVATSQKSPTLMGLVCARDRFGPRPTTYHDNSISI